MSARIRRATLIAVFAVAAVVLGVTAPLAEVGVHFQTNVHSDLRIPYIILGITEEPNPFGSVWMELGGFNPSRVVLNAQGSLNNDGPPSLV